MTTSLHGKAFIITRPLWEESIGDRWNRLTKSQWCETLMFSFMLAWTSCWIKNRCISDLRRHVANVTSVQDADIKWKHFPRYWPFVRGIHRSPVNSPHKGQWRGALMFSLICVWINGWVNNREAGDLRRYRAHYDVTVMSMVNFSLSSSLAMWPSPCLPTCFHVTALPSGWNNGLWLTGIKSQTLTKYCVPLACLNRRWHTECFNQIKIY